MSNLPDEKITAPYNFAPLSSQVFQPDWQDKVSIDTPMAGGLSGVLNFTITAHSPLLVGEKAHEKAPVEPFTFPDGRYGIPGSSLRGMIRNVLEIASFGKMNFVDDKRYGVRDLTPGARAFYGNHMTETAGRMKFKPKSKSGWLQFNEGRWQILPCEFSRVEHRDIERYLSGQSFAAFLKKRPVADDKYKFWKKAGKSLEVKFTAGGATFQKHKGKELYYSKVGSLGSGSMDGEIVFTGQPGPTKHMEFVFHTEAKAAKEIPERVIQGFLQIYRGADCSMDSSKNKTTDKKLSHWEALQSLDFKHGFPVFYLEKNGVIESLGLSLMYKLAYTNSVGDVIERVQGNYDADKPDLCELIFGYVDEDQGVNSLKGRVSFAHAVCEQASNEVVTKQYQTILNGPKPTYYPNYIVQKHKDGELEGKGYTTLMAADAEIRGWKRYPVRPGFEVATLSKDQQANKDIQVSLKPLMAKPALSFRSKLRFHNLSQCELGALVWAMEWGGNTQLRHSLGMAKSFGFGQVSITLDTEDTQYLEANDFSDTPALDDCVGSFVKTMDDFCNEAAIPGGWEACEQLLQLRGMANPENAPGLPGRLKHLDLNGGGKWNEFVTAKKEGKVLESYMPSSLPSAPSGSGVIVSNGAWDNSDAGKWLRDTVTEISERTNSPVKNVLHAKGLAEQWSLLEDAELKQAVLVQIKKYWQTQDWWGEPHGKSAIKAHRIYSAE
ncbi:TIGR03986 family type III CRISPR-associated RAMP protein [Leucothrix pacifica]|uniref:TIGR03986 family CRISPR-associated RAMP protein n=1 Tax=Leucothrix pacifica TaxID=1247513 RepID=A0A317C102_9GAMM|nr:TIGR03986 family CRISPR-associated RAMP protein [Leucothrix pacifica]PWQ92324.1 TIGR03986 family CRISPR-associated RAMP protein [Leucothrix pacifica]